MFTTLEFLRIEVALEDRVAHLKGLVGTDKDLSQIVSEYEAIVEKVNEHVIAAKKLELRDGYEEDVK